VSASDRERPLVTGVNGTLMARRAVVRPELMAASAEAGCQFRGEPDMTGVEVLGQGGGDQQRGRGQPSGS